MKATIQSFSSSSSALTYTLGRSLYVPLTSRCNTKTLPQTRGPKFQLPAHVVSTLCRFRDWESETRQWHHWCNYLDTTEYPQALPEYLFERITEMPANHPLEFISELKASIRSELEASSINDYESLVIAGEGEPTLQWDALLSIANEFSTMTKIRVVTNGLLMIPTSTSTDAVLELKQHGVHAVSVALMTDNSNQYNQLMDPMHTTGAKFQPYDAVCDFIQSAVNHDLEVEVTAVDRPDVNKVKTEAIAHGLGVKKLVRWRPYFP